MRAASAAPEYILLALRNAVKFDYGPNSLRGSKGMGVQIVDRGDGLKIVGTRITIYTIFEYLKAGWDRASIANWLAIETAAVEAAERYIDEHRDEVAAAFQKIRERIDRGNPPELQAKLDATHERFMEKVRVMRSPDANSANGANHAGSSCGQ